MKNQNTLKVLEAENAKLRKQLKEIKSIINAKEILEQINGGPSRVLDGMEDKSARLEHIENTFDQDDEELTTSQDRSDIN
jgi:hypothetical protein